ncbi:MAG: hypothetical protein AB8B85_12520 [Paracoccaceae bacterium]
MAEPATAKVAEWVAKSGPGAEACLIEAPADLPFSLWTQDLFLARVNGELVIPPHFDRYRDLDAARILANGAGHPLAETTAYFEGGNIIPAGDLLLIGADLVTLNGGNAEALATHIDESRRPLVLGTAAPVKPETTEPTERPAKGWTHTIHWKISEGSTQPMFHIDLFVAPAGEEHDGTPRFLVGCPRRAARLLRHPDRPHALADKFDEVAATLEKAGARVIRNPLPLIWKDQPEKQHRTWFHLPVNNVLIEDLGPQGRTVWLPGFASKTWPELSVVDNENAAIWAMLGYSVTRIPGLMPLAENLGALHCMAKIVARAPD